MRSVRRTAQTRSRARFTSLRSHLGTPNLRRSQGRARCGSCRLRVVCADSGAFSRMALASAAWPGPTLSQSSSFWSTGPRTACGSSKSRIGPECSRPEWLVVGRRRSRLGLSRWRSRVRVPSLPSLKCLQLGRSGCLLRLGSSSRGPRSPEKLPANDDLAGELLAGRTNKPGQ